MSTWFDPETKARLSTEATRLLKAHGMDTPCNLQKVDSDKRKNRKRLQRRKARLKLRLSKRLKSKRNQVKKLSKVRSPKENKTLLKSPAI